MCDRTVLFYGELSLFTVGTAYSGQDPLLVDCRGVGFQRIVFVLVIE